MATEAGEKGKVKISRWFNVVLAVGLVIALASAALWIKKWTEENRVLKAVIARLSADSRIAEVLVTKSEYDEALKKIRTTIKFLEYDAAGNTLSPKYFSFIGNIIQFQSLVVRFEDALVGKADPLKGKSVYLFMKAFVLDGKNTQVFDITPAHEIPSGYKIPGIESEFERGLWEKFWDYALEPEMRKRFGVKNAQIEAPGSLFRPGTIYTLRIEHDGGIRIDALPVPEVLRGEKL